MPASAHALVTPPIDTVASVGSGLEGLRARVAEVVASSRPAGPAWPTGVASLDVALGGGLPRGRITEVVGASGAGRATLLRGVVARVLQGGGWVAWVDARRTAAPQSWTGLGKRLVMVRPLEARRGAWCADQLLRSGVFALVVLDGAPPLHRVQGVRLSGLARERDAAFVVITDAVTNGATTGRISGAVRLRVSRDTQDAHGTVRSDARSDARGDARSNSQHTAHETARGFRVIVEKGAALRTVEVNSAIVVARRVCAHSEIPDRRGVARGARRAWTARGGDTSTGTPSVTWGGLGASVGNETRDVRSDAGRDTARPPLSRGDTERAQRDLDRRTRDWSAYRGRRRAGESSYARYSRRDAARATIGERERERTREHQRERTREHTHERTREHAHARVPVRARSGAALGHAAARPG
ncbi:MAG: hypothetical protein V4617_01485 [Gemmatimonadota bacterium]